MFDLVVASLGLIALFPVLMLTSIVIKLTSSGPIMYKGQRVGLRGRDFEILKFRTMWNYPTAQMTTALNDPRVTPVGRWLRRYKLDELPQLINILRGDMSIVGPRPEFRGWVDLYSPHELAILAVRPGLTDFASIEFMHLDEIVGGGCDADARYLSEAFDRKNELRLKYIDEMSWRTDLKLIARTAVKIVQAG